MISFSGRAASLIAIFTIVAAAPARAWNGATHSAITIAVVLNDPSFKGTVPAETLDALVASPEFKSDFGTVSNFIHGLQLNGQVAPGASAPLSFQLGETAGSPVEIGKLFAEYVLEPDWGMDQNGCNKLYSCDEKYKWMGAFDEGLPSQAFRHMYWPGGYDEFALDKNLIPDLLHGHATEHVDSPIGEAPQRGELFFNLSVRAANSGHPYWALRFLAWAMHYAQDVTQPFHAAQIPSQQLEAYYVKSPIKIPNVSETTRMVTYYHIAFEEYMDSFAQGISGSIAAADAMQKAVTAQDATVAAANFGSLKSQDTGNAAWAYFPSIPAKKDMSTDDIKPYLAAHLSDELKQKSQSQAAEVTAVQTQRLDDIASQCMVEAGSASKTLLELFKSELKMPLASTPPAGKIGLGNLSTDSRPDFDGLR